MKHISFFILTFSIFLFATCTDYVPKPSGFLRIDLPEQQYKVTKFERFQFEISDQAIISPIYQENSLEENFNIKYQSLEAEIFCTYFSIKKEKIAELSEESRKFVYMHTLKADAIQEEFFNNEKQKVYGMVYTIRGNVASPTQFILTDSINSFFRGALYFNNTPNQDSIAPVLDYLNQDIQVLIESFQWK